MTEPRWETGEPEMPRGIEPERTDRRLISIVAVLAAFSLMALALSFCTGAARAQDEPTEQPVMLVIWQLLAPPPALVVRFLGSRALPPDICLATAQANNFSDAPQVLMTCNPIKPEAPETSDAEPQGRGA